MAFPSPNRSKLVMAMKGVKHAKAISIDLAVQQSFRFAQSIVCD
jgi:hypothetical protein